MAEDVIFYLLSKSADIRRIDLESILYFKSTLTSENVDQQCDLIYEAINKHPEKRLILRAVVKEFARNLLKITPPETSLEILDKAENHPLLKNVSASKISFFEPHISLQLLEIREFHQNKIQNKSDIIKP